jgi:hypothetical protein
MAGAEVQRLTLARLNDWIRKAQPGARLCYGHGDHASHVASEDVNATLRQLAEREFLFLCQGQRGLNGRAYLAIRSSRPAPEGALS